MNQEQQHLTKLLTPLIVFIVLIIVLTLVFHGRSLEQKGGEKKQLPSLEMRLDRKTMDNLPFSRKKEPRQEFRFPKAEEILSSARYEYSANLFEQAEERLRTALVFYPDHVQIYHLLGSILYKQQKFAEAEPVFRHLLELNRNDTLAQNNLASVLAALGRYPEALVLAERAYILDNSSAVTALNLAGICARNGEKQKALFYFRKAYEKLGPGILHFLNNRNLDPIRQESAFRKIVEEAKNRQQQGRKS